MSQHDFDIANQTSSNARADINNALKALASTSSGTTAPSTTYANMLWYDTSANILKMRAEADDAWINIGYLDQSADAFRILDDTQVVTTAGSQTGLLGDQATGAWQAGTGTTESLVSPAKIKAAILANATTPSPTYTSSEQAFTALQTVNHGLGRVPAFYSVALRCKVANNGYSVGDEIQVSGMVDGDGARGYVTWANSVYIKVRNQVLAIQDTNGNYVLPTASHWKYVFYAF